MIITPGVLAKTRYDWASKAFWPTLTIRGDGTFTQINNQFSFVKFIEPVFVVSSFPSESMTYVLLTGAVGWIRENDLIPIKMEPR